MKGLFILILLASFPLFPLKSECIKGNCRIGNGTFHFNNGSTYKGQFYKGVPHGKGVMNMKNGDRYEGTFSRGQKHGEGKYFFRSGNKYIGQFKKDKIEGKGRMDYSNNDVYKGSWSDNKPHGKGRIEFANGKIMEGLWRKGKLVRKWKTESNNSVSTSSIKRTYKDCNNNYCHNESGKFTYRDRSYYIGQFTDGNPQGKGTCYYANGDIYEGGWKNHGPNGRGIITFKSGRKYSAIWKNGKPVEQVYEDAEHTVTNNSRYRKAADGKVDMYAIVIGISAYEHMPSLKYTDDDAYQLYAFLKSPEGGALPDNHITLLVDEVATKQNIRTSMQNVFGKADQDDVVIMYYSGHGLQGRFLPIDFDGYNNSLSHREIYDLLDQSAAKHKVLIADACYAGSLETEKGTFYSSLENFYHKIDESDGGTAIMMSSRAQEKSLEYSGLRQGVFSHFLLRGMKGEADTNSDEIVSIAELYRYIYDGVRQYTNKRQSPTIGGNYDKNMPLAMIRTP